MSATEAGDLAGVTHSTHGTRRGRSSSVPAASLAHLIQGDARRIPLADRSVHCVVTSPPYWGLRDYGVAGQIGLEETPEAFVASMVAVFREVRRVLRDDGTLWLNLGDSYNAQPGQRKSTDKCGLKQASNVGANAIGSRSCDSLKPKDLVGIPWRVALALQADGWYLRSDIIWAKPNPMPESVTDRPTKAHEYLFLFSKDERYFYDADAIREEGEGYGRSNWNAMQFKGGDITRNHGGKGSHGRGGGVSSGVGGRNKRSVWTVATQPFPGAHFATFPPKLIEPCVKAGTSERGCCRACGTPWERVVERAKHERTGEVLANGRDGGLTAEDGMDRTGLSHFKYNEWLKANPPRTVGWQPTCSCNAGDPVPCTILDPFNGAGTTGVVALALGRSYVGLDLNPDYLAMARRRIDRPHAPIETARPEEPLPLFAGGAS